MIGFVGCLVMYRAPAPQPFERGLLGYGTKRRNASSASDLTRSVRARRPSQPVLVDQRRVRG